MGEEAGFAGVAGVEEEGAGHRFAEGLVGVTEDDDGGALAGEAGLELVGERVGVDDVLEEELAAGKGDEFGERVGEAGIVGVAGDGGDGGDLFELEEDGGQPMSPPWRMWSTPAKRPGMRGSR